MEYSAREIGVDHYDLLRSLVVYVNHHNKDYLRKTPCDWLCADDAAFVKLLWPLVTVTISLRGSTDDQGLVLCVGLRMIPTCASVTKLLLCTFLTGLISDILLNKQCTLLYKHCCFVLLCWICGSTTWHSWANHKPDPRVCGSAD